MNIINTKSGNSLVYNLDKWTVSKHRICKIIDESNEFYLLENKSKDRINFAKSLIASNRLDIIENTVELSEGLYEHHFIKAIKDREINQMNDLFNNNIELIFKYKETVLKKAEYYLIQPLLLRSGGAYIGGFKYSLGTLVDSFNSDNPFFFEELFGHKKMYLIRISGSPLSGNYQGVFWADEESKMIYLSSSEISSLRNKSFYENIEDFKKEVGRDLHFNLDYQAKAINQLITEIENFN